MKKKLLNIKIFIYFYMAFFFFLYIKRKQSVKKKTFVEMEHLYIYTKKNSTFGEKEKKSQNGRRAPNTNVINFGSRYWYF